MKVNVGHIGEKIILTGYINRIEKGGNHVVVLLEEHPKEGGSYCDDFKFLVPVDMIKSYDETEKEIWNRSQVVAACNVMHLYDEPVIAASLLQEEHLTEFDCSDLSAYDKESLRKINFESGMDLTGLYED